MVLLNGSLRHWEKKTKKTDPVGAGPVSKEIVYVYLKDKISITFPTQKIKKKSRF